ncbi:MAG: sulfotransferase [Actinomycetota bacterium]|nr:sulfotransferase [Actinomycetota bacterium]
MTPRGPNFFLAGAAKSGTTTLYEALRSHPDVYLPAPKEPHVYAYLADPSTASHLFTDERAARRWYRELYAGVGEETAVGDGSTTNLVVPGAAEAIARDVPDGRVVVILRHPVDRAFSHFCHFVTTGGEDVDDFAEAVRSEAARQAQGFPFTYRYLGWSRYAGQLRPFVELFGRDRVLVHLFDDLCADPEAVVRTTLRFLGVDDAGPLPPVGRHNVVRAPTTAPAGVRRLFRGRRDGNRRPPARPSLDPAVRAELTAAFEDEIRGLEELIDRDLTAWRGAVGVTPAGEPPPRPPAVVEPGPTA